MLFSTLGQGKAWQYINLCFFTCVCVEACVCVCVQGKEGTEALLCYELCN